MQFRQRLSAELAQRCRRNPHYSLRAFARDLGTDHATLSQILRERRPLSARNVAMFGRRLQFDAASLTTNGVEQNAEAVARLISSGHFRPDTRWIAVRTGLPIDKVNAALHLLIARRALVMNSPTSWKLSRNVNMKGKADA